MHALLPWCGRQVAEGGLLRGSTPGASRSRPADGWALPAGRAQEQGWRAEVLAGGARWLPRPGLRPSAGHRRAAPRRRAGATAPRGGQVQPGQAHAPQGLLHAAGMGGPGLAAGAAVADEPLHRLQACARPAPAALQQALPWTASCSTRVLR